VPTTEEENTILKLSNLLTIENIKKTFLYIKNYGFRAFLIKATGKVLDITESDADASAPKGADSCTSDFREKNLAEAYIRTVAKDPNSFVDLISPDDEMYIFTRNHVDQKETALYLYFKSGREALQCIEQIVRFSEKSFRGVRSFLDFACGYGKSTRFLIQEIEPGKVWVSDIYKGAVDFQKKIFGVNGFYSETEPSKLEFPRKFEVIYTGSLFSHLPANRFEEWLSTLSNILEDDGIFILSTHGETLCPPGFQVDPSGFTFLKFSESRSLSTEEYGCTFVTRAWVERLGEKLGIMNIYFLEKELWGSQDIYVVTKRDMPSLNNVLPKRFPQGNVESIHIAEDGGVSVRGWAIDGEFGAPVKEVLIYVGDAFLGRAALGTQRPDVADHFKRADCLNSGWQYSAKPLGVMNDEIKRESCFIIIKALIKNQRGDVTYLFSTHETNK